MSTIKELTMNDFQIRLQDLLNDYNLSRLQLSKIIMIQSSAIDKYFTMNLYPSMPIAKKMTQYFNCSLDYLFGRSDDIKSNNKNTKSFFNTFDMLLKENNLPVARAMRELDMSENNYYRWKKGLFPKTLKLLEIAKYFEVSIDFLVGYTGNNDE